MARRGDAGTIEVRYRAGDWFLLPLGDGRCAPGRVVANPAGHLILGYLFPPVEARPTVSEVASLQPGEAIMAGNMSGLGIAMGYWPLLGGATDFDPRSWPGPEVEVESMLRPGETVLRVEVLDHRLRRSRGVYLPLDAAGDRQLGGSMGYGFAAKHYEQQLSAGSARPLHQQPWWQRALNGGPDGGPDPAYFDGVPDDLRGGPADAVPFPPVLVKVVLPGRVSLAEADLVECDLLLHLPEGAGDVDGSVTGDDATEVWVYGEDPLMLPALVRAALTDTVIPAGTHLLVRNGPPGSPEAREALR